MRDAARQAANGASAETAPGGAVRWSQPMDGFKASPFDGGPGGSALTCYAIQAGTGSPYSRRNGGLKSFDAYRAPPSAKIVTTVWPGPSDLATRTAAAMLM